MGKKKKAKKISEFDKMRIMRDAYKGMMGYWQEEAQRERAGCDLMVALLDDDDQLRRWSAAWKGKAREYREKIVELRRSHSLEELGRRVGRLERLAYIMQEDVYNLGGPEPLESVKKYVDGD